MVLLQGVCKKKEMVLMYTEEAWIDTSKWQLESQQQREERLNWKQASDMGCHVYMVLINILCQDSSNLRDLRIVLRE